MSLDQDQIYIDKAINGDTRAFAVLMDRYKNMVFTLAMKVLKNRQEAEEVSQDVFVKIFRVLPTFKGDSKFSTWLYKIAYNRSLDGLKKQKRKSKTITSESSIAYNLPSLENTAQHLEIKERRVIIRESMGELQAGDSLVLTLHYFEELSLREIAEIMNLEPNTVKIRLFRSRKRLGELLKNRLEPETIKSYGGK